MKIKILSVVVLSVLMYQHAYSQISSGKFVEVNGKEKLLGKIGKQDLQKNSFAGWFNKNYENYHVNESVLNGNEKLFKKYKILAFMGTWCGDSKREVPRFYKILESVSYPIDNFSLIAVDNTREHYKKSPSGEEQGLNIIKVPTFIFYKNGKEVNRIVESPVESLEKDILDIITKKRYIPNYSTAEN